VHAKFEIRTFTRSWDNRRYQKIKLGSPWIRPRSLFSKIFNGLMFRWTLWIHQSNLKSVAFPVPGIIGGIQKMCAVSTLTFLQNFSGAFIRMDPLNVLAKCEFRSFSRSWDNRGTQKFGQSLDTPTLPFLQNFSWAFIQTDTLNVLAKFEIRSFSRSRDNRGYTKN